MNDNYLRDDKKQKRTTDQHVKEMVDSMSQRKRRGVQRKPLGDNEV